MGAARGVGTGWGLLVAMLATGACDRSPVPTTQPSSSGRVSVAGRTRIFYEVQGQGDTLILIHGGFTDRRIWNPQFDDLSRNFTVVRYDLRGFGRSDPAIRPYRPSRDLLALYETLDLGQAALVGLSTGGEVALAFALAHPDRVTGLVLASSPAPGLEVPPEADEQMEAVLRAAVEGGNDSAVRAWMAHPRLAALERDRELANQVEFLARENVRTFALPFRLFLPDDPPPSQRLGEILVPAIVMWGDQDEEWIQRNSAVTAERIPGARTVVLRGAGHLVNLERPSEFNRAVRDLMQRAD